MFTDGLTDGLGVGSLAQFLIWDNIGQKSFNSLHRYLCWRVSSFPTLPFAILHDSHPCNNTTTTMYLNNPISLFWIIYFFEFFIQQVLIEVIREHCHRFHLLDMLTDVNQRVVDKQSGSPNRVTSVQVPYLTHTLRAKVHLGMKVMNRIWRTREFRVWIDEVEGGVE